MRFEAALLIKACAFAPGHITGFFQVCDKDANPLMKGSRGAGVSVSKGVTTSVEIEPAKESHIRVEINGNSSHPATVSESVICRILKFFTEEHFDIHVVHEVALPIGYGFGTSGAGALSLSLALNKALDLNLTRTKAAQIAHIVEVENKTGLGTVIAETAGGIEIRVEAGGPGVGRIVTLPSSSDYCVVCLPFGPIPTPRYLTDNDARRRINEQGGFLTDSLRSHPTVTKFLTYSRHFAEHIGILSDRVRAVFQETDVAGFTCSTAIFGENVFTIVKPDQVPRIKAILDKHKTPTHDVLVMKVDCKGARVIDE